MALGPRLCLGSTQDRLRPISLIPALGEMQGGGSEASPTVGALAGGRPLEQAPGGRADPAAPWKMF